MGKITAIFRRTFSFLSFRRKKTDTESPVEPDSLPAAKKTTSDIDATRVSANRPPATENNSIDTDSAGTKPSIWKRATARVKLLFSKRSTTPLESDDTDTPPKTTKKQSSQEEVDDSDTAELKPGLWQRISARFTPLFNKRSKAVNDADTLNNPDNTSVSSDVTEDELSESLPKKRRIPVKKLLMLVLPVLAVTLIIAGTTVMITRSNAKQKEVAALEEKHKKSVGDELKKLKDKNNALLEENKKLRVAPSTASPPGTARETAPVASQNIPTENPAPAPTSSKSRAPVSIGDCSVTSKESAGESLKRCIEAYNAASSH